MELTFEKDDLLYALQLLQGVTGGWNTLRAFGRKAQCFSFGI